MIRRERISKLELIQVTQSFEDNSSILKDVSFSIPLGKTIVIQGNPGSGKSMLLKIMAGLIEPTKGDVVYNDRKIKEETFEDLIPLKLSTSLCFENGGLLMNKTIEDNLKLSLQYHNQWRTERSLQLFEELVRDFGLKSFLHLRPAQVSSGVRKITGLVRAFLSNAQIIFLDEPTLGIGDQSCLTLKHWFERFRKESLADATLVLTSSDQKFVSELECEKWLLKDSELKKVA